MAGRTGEWKEESECLPDALNRGQNNGTFRMQHLADGRNRDAKDRRRRANECCQLESITDDH